MNEFDDLPFPLWLCGKIFRLVGDPSTIFVSFCDTEQQPAGLTTAYPNAWDTRLEAYVVAAFIDICQGKTSGIALNRAWYIENDIPRSEWNMS